MQEVSGGSIHHVFRISTDTETYYLKIRGTHYKLNSHVASSPDDIAREAHALEILDSTSLEYFPKLLAYNESLGCALLTSVDRNATIITQSLNSNKLKPEFFYLLGASVARVHNATTEIKFVHKDDRDFYSSALFNHIESLGYAGLSWLPTQLKNAHRSFIMGDLSPKNILFNNEHAYFIDFDKAHIGNVVFELGYVLGHLLLHTINIPPSPGAVSQFMSGYTSLEQHMFEKKDEKLIVGCLLATIIYRINNKWVPYDDLLMNQGEKARILHIALECINMEIDLMNIERIVREKYTNTPR